MPAGQLLERPNQIIPFDPTPLNLASSSKQLPPKSVQHQRRGHFERPHFALWADSSASMMMSREYRS